MKNDLWFSEDMLKLKYRKNLNIKKLFRDGVSGNGREVFRYFSTSLDGFFVFRRSGKQVA